MCVRRAVQDLLILFILIRTAYAGLVNISIDDTYGDLTTGLKPVYQPNGAPWYQPNCNSGSTCGSIVPPASSTFDQTWTAATYSPGSSNISITFSFTGVSVWVYFVLANNANQYGIQNASTTCNFTIDGNYISTFSHQPSASTAFQFNASVFTASGLSNSQHELVISTNDFPDTTFICFDYAIYTADVPDSATFSKTGPTSTGGITGTSSTTSTPTSSQAYTSSSNSRLGIIIGCVLGGLALAVLVAVLALFRRLKRKQQESRHMEPIISSFKQPSPQGYRDDVPGGSTHLPWQNSLYTGSGTLHHPHGSISSPSSDLPSASTLSPVRRGFQSPSQPPLHAHSTKSRDELRAVRQMEIDERLQVAQQQMVSLTSRHTRTQTMLRAPAPSSISGIGTGTGTGPGSSISSSAARRLQEETEHEMESMREQIRQLTAQIEHLQTERSSDWAQGLSDEPPPAYA